MGEKKKVMIVDDDVDLVAANRAILKASGYDVAVAHDGSECLERIASEVPDLILMDMMMSTYTEGIDVINKLRESPQTERIPIILITSVDMRSAYGGNPDESLPVDQYLVKPVDPATLVKSVNGLLRK
jgi:two-component system alkaline phosphatase synthesis response regulator PhoP